MMLNDDGISDLITINKDNSESIKLVNKNDEITIIPQILDSNQSPTNSDQIEQNDKVFTVNDIQTLMNNQLLHKSQLDQNLENNKLDQHIILVTQNGDKIILIQNPSVSDTTNQAQIQLNTSTGHQRETIDHKKNSGSINKQFKHNVQSNNVNHQFPISRNSPLIDSSLIDENDEQIDEIRKIRQQHKLRQQYLMLWYDRMKEKNKNSKTDNIDDNSITEDDDDFWEFDETNEFEKSKTNHKSRKLNDKKKSILNEKFYCEAKWYPSFCYSLEKAYNYFKRRSDNIEQLSKFYPTSSESFENRCNELKKHLKKLELNLERFQNVMGKDIHLIENKLKNFFQEYQLEQFQSEIEDEDQKDLCNLIDNHQYTNHNQHVNHLSTSSLNQNSILTYNTHQSVIINNFKKNSSSLTKNSLFNKLGSSSKMQIITPSSISIIPTEIINDEIDPVPEIRDIQSPDVSLEEMDKFYTNGNLNKSSYQQPTVSIKPKKSFSRKSSSVQKDLRPTKQQKKV